MGTNDEKSFPNERPARLVQVQRFWMNEHDVTNAEFYEFVEATVYVTTAEREIDWNDLKKELPPIHPSQTTVLLHLKRWCLLQPLDLSRSMTCQFGGVGFQAHVGDIRKVREAVSRVRRIIRLSDVLVRRCCLSETGGQTAGNVWQWCTDWYRADSNVEAASKNVCRDPSGPTTARVIARVRVAGRRPTPIHPIQVSDA